MTDQDILLLCVIAAAILALCSVYTGLGAGWRSWLFLLAAFAVMGAGRIYVYWFG